MKKLLAGAMTALVVGIFGCAGETESAPDVESEETEQVGETEQEVKGGNKPICALKCAAPPDGCHYENAVLTGPCNKLTCGELVCDGTPG
ncbi:MAG: hypothetical protein IPM79_25640 [Polyangiaceae bacterium]|nr:hypothetical protein [Polyangiaceae bacterium]MBK8940907.1 hypothetical protein [Polyangiaceae bacterium]